MAFDRPTLPQLIERLQADIEGRIASVDPRLRRSVLGAIGRAESGVAHGLHGHLAYLAKQLNPATADEEYLAIHADWWGVDRVAASAAGGSCDAVGTDGSVIAAGLVLQRADGAEYTTDAEVIITGGTASVAVTCGTAGQDGNSVAGVGLTFVSPVPGVQSKVTVDAGGLTGGADIEDVESWRDRFRARVQKQPQGGSKADYEAWALEVAGVTHVWVMAQWLGAGTVGVFFVREDDADLIPDAAEVQAVQDHLDSVRPVTADLTVLAPVAVPEAMTISLSPNTSLVQAAVSTALADLFRREAEVEDGAGSGTILISHIKEAISLASGEIDHALVAPIVNLTYSAGEIGTLGVITFQAL